MKVVITGSDGFIGKNLREYLVHYSRNIPSFSIVSIDRLQYDIDNMSKILEDVDIIVHCAGVNRGELLVESNLAITKKLQKSIENSKFHGRLINLSSIQAVNKTEYGRVKNYIEIDFERHSQEFNYLHLSLRLPNIFGPYSRPNYNTVVSTFIQDILTKRDSVISNDQINLLFVKKLCGQIVDYFKSDQSDHIIEIPSTYEVNVRELYSRIENLIHNTSKHQLILNDNLDKDLFRTITYFRMNLDLIVGSNIMNSDERGWFIELFRTNSESQTSISLTTEDVERGNHYHINKLERFLILKGNAEVRLQDFEGNENQYFLTENEFIDIPNYSIHTLRKVNCDNLLCAFWVDEHYDINNPDTFYK